MIVQKAKDIKPFIVMEVLEKAAEMEKCGIHVIHMEVGEPDFDVPSCVAKAVENAYREGRTHLYMGLILILLRTVPRPPEI